MLTFVTKDISATLALFLFCKISDIIDVPMVFQNHSVFKKQNENLSKQWVMDLFTNLSGL
jgi:hypothetical protein